MSIYLLQSQQQTGPYTESQVQHLLQTAVITGGTLGWKEGMTGWAPLSGILSASLVPPVPGYPVLPTERKSPLGLASLVMSLVSAPLWLAFLVAAGLMHNSGHVSEGFNMIVGFAAIGGLFINFAGLVIGLVATFKSKPNTMAIIGSALNGFILLGIVGLIALGIAMQHAHSGT